MTAPHDLPDLATLVARARDWIAVDPDAATRQELDVLVDQVVAGDPDALAELADRFAGDLAFGTAGLRGEMGAGPNRMNLAVVIRAAAAIAAWVTGEAPDGAARGVIIGHDARRGSAEFAAATAEVLAAHGVRAHVPDGPLPTPVLAFGVRHVGAAAGVMVTASHNPRGDNGYKVYDGSGRQIVSPVDRQIATVMGGIARSSDVPRGGPDDPDIVRLGGSLLDAYLSAAAELVGPADTGAPPVAVAYTAMHGVGAEPMRRLAAAIGLAPMHEVAVQSRPDPEFPTVAFPNPEEPGALDLGIAEAARTGAALLIAHDPDADRLGAAVPDPELGDPTTPVGWRILRGDEIGCLLAWHLLEQDLIPPDGLLATTIVSSTLLAAMAAAADLPFAETLTGFKWIARAPVPPQRLGFGYEEALGFCVGDLVGDKDGITAAAVLVLLVAALAAQGRTVLDVLDDLARRHGVHRTAQHVVRLDGLGARRHLDQLMEQVRAEPPAVIDGRTVHAVHDLIAGDPDRGLAPADVVIFRLDHARVVVRPSGTEPKLKCYVEVVEPVGDHEPLADARQRADRAAASLIGAIRAIAAIAGA